VLVSLASPVAAQDATVAAFSAPLSSGATIERDAEGGVTLRAVRLVKPLVVNGRLDDEIYNTVPPAGGFIQQDPDEGAPATEKTDVWVLFDEDNLYISARCWDSQPERMIANDMLRDGNLNQNESLVVTLDTFHDHRTGYYFQTNPLGALRDIQIGDERTGSIDWNTVWDVKTDRDEHGWTIEMVLPFKSLRYKASGPQTWGVNFRRGVRWKNETSFLTAIPRSYGGRGPFKISSSATLIGLDVPPQGRNFELKPYAKSTLATDRIVTPAVSNDVTADVGLDVKYGLTKGLIADFTANTDFAQVEADEVQVNLTRFSLFFPEKRDFFLESQGIFQFVGAQRPQGSNVNLPENLASTPLAPIMFFSRAIGLSDGREAPIRAGGRVTGRVGPYSVGLLNIQTGRDDAVGAVSTNFSVARIRRDILSRSWIGAIGTHRSVQENGIGSNQMFGVDTSLGFYDSVSVLGYYARTRTPGAQGGESSYFGRFDYAADRYGLNVEHLAVGDAFDPQIGFTPRVGFHRSYGAVRMSPRPDWPGVRKLSMEASIDYITDPSWHLETREVRGGFRLDMNNGDQWLTEVARNYEFLNEPFEIAAGVNIPTGGYDFGEFSTLYVLGPARRLSTRVNLIRGTFYDGRRTVLGVSNGRLEVSPQWSIEPRVSLNWVDLPAGRFTATAVGGRINFTMNPRMSLTTLVQYNSSASSLTSNVRFRWEYTPGSDFYAVYTDGRDTTLSGRPVLQNRAFILKATRLLRW
jgi:hypothetical protein